MRWITLIALLAAASASAETATLVCDYKQMSSEENGLEEVTENFVLTFIIDDETRKAYMVGNNGSVEVMLVPNSGDALTFIELTDSGNVMTTTMTMSGKSVHSRNSVLLGELLPSQYYGTCEEK